MFPTNIMLHLLSNIGFLLFGSSHIHLYRSIHTVKIHTYTTHGLHFFFFFFFRFIFFYNWGACAINFIPHHNTLQFRRLLQAPTSTPEVEMSHTHSMYIDRYMVYIYTKFPPYTVFHH